MIGKRFHNIFHPLLLTSCRRLTVTDKDGIKTNRLNIICVTPSEVGFIGL